MKEREKKRKRCIGLLSNHGMNKVHFQLLQSALMELEKTTADGLDAVDYDRVAAGKTNKITSTVESVVAQRDSERRRLQRDMAALQGKIERVEIALAHLPYAQRTLLELRYFEHLTWRQIAFHVPYSEDYLRKQLHEKALDALANYLFI